MRIPDSTFFPVPQVSASTMFGRDQADGNKQVPMPNPMGGTNAGNQPQPQNQIPLRSSYQRPPPPSSGYRVPLTGNGAFPPPEQAGIPPCVSNLRISFIS